MSLKFGRFQVLVFCLACSTEETRTQPCCPAHAWLGLSSLQWLNPQAGASWASVFLQAHKKGSQERGAAPVTGKGGE